MYITNKVSDTKINGDGIFSYNINISYTNETYDTIASKVTIFFPEFITYVLPSEDDIIKSIDIVTEEGGNLVTFNLLDGISSINYNFNINAYFNELRENNQMFTCSAMLYIDDVLKETATSDTVTLELISEYDITIQNDDLVGSYRGSTFLVTTNLLQRYDCGVVDENLVLDYVISGSAIIDESFTPTITDKSQIYTDDHLSGVIPVINDDKTNITFNLDYYKGEELEIVYQVLVTDEALYSETISIDLEYSSDDTKATTYNTSVLLKYSDSAMDYLGYSGEMNAINSLITTNILLRNSSNYQARDCEYIISPTSDTYIKNYKFSIDKNSISSYSVYYKLNTDDDYMLIFENLTESLEKTNTDYYTSDETYVKTIKITFDTFEIGTEFNEFTCQVGTWQGKSWTSYNSVYSSLSFVNDTDDYIFTTKNTINVSDESDYKLSLINEKGIVDLSEAAEVPIQIKVKPTYNPAINPVVIYEMMPGFEVDETSIYYSYYDDFDDVTYYSYDSSFPLDLSNIITETIDNPNGDGSILLRIIFNDISIVKYTELIVYFTLKYTGSNESYFNNYAYMGGTYDPSDNLLLITDENDYDNDTLVDDLIYKTRPLVFSDIGTSSTIVVENSVTLNGIDYYEDITVTNTDEFIYEVNVSDSSNVDLKDITITSILPHIDDTYVTNPSISRGSDSLVYLSGDITVKVRDNDTSTLSDISDYEIFYSTGYDPIRFNYLNEEIGSDVWTSEKPSDYEKIKSFKIVISSDYILEGSESLVVQIPSKMTAINKENNVCINTFSINLNEEIDGETVNITPFETTAVTTNLINTSIDGFTWIDSNDDGIYETDENKINDVLVSLYDESKNLISEVLTGSDELYGDGYYRFDYVTPGYYFIKFKNPENYHVTIQNLTDENGSKIDPDLEYNQVEVIDNLYNYNAGFTDSPEPSEPIILINSSIVLEGSSFNPYSIVTAYDYLGNDITDKIIVTENNVDPDVLGDYTVTYEVTDDYGNTTVLSYIISVLSEDQIDRYNSISTFYESKALISAAIANILNSESQKIETVMENDPILEDVININDSVNSMVQTVTALEVTSVNCTKIFDNCSLLE